MTKHVLDVGNCAPDHAAIRHLIEGNFKAKVEQAHKATDTLTCLETGEFALILVNRKLDCDYSDGIEVIRRIKAAPAGATVPVMMVTNFPEHQQAAVAAGAVEGFGKNHLDSPATLERLREYLG